MMMTKMLFTLAWAVSVFQLVESGTAPGIGSRSSVFKVSPGKMAFIPCVVSGDPRPTVTWDRDGEVISELDRRFSINKESLALRIFRLHVDDQGNYTCTARNEHGVATMTATLLVMIQPEVHIVSPKNLTFMELTNQELVCRSRALPKPHFEWLTNHDQRIRSTDVVIGNPSGRRIYSIDREVGEQLYESVLKFEPITFKDFGRFACVAYNDIGHSRVTVTLDVYFSPKVISQHSIPQSVTWWPGHPTNLTCAVAGNDLPAITWTRNGRGFKCNRPAQHQEMGEVVATCTLQDEKDGGPGVYVCAAANSLGQASIHEFHVRENFPPPPVEFAPISRQQDEMTLSVRVPFKEDTPPTTYVLVNYKLVSVGDEIVNPEFQRTGDVNERGEGTVTLVGLRQNSNYLVKVRGKNSVGLGEETTRILNSAQPSQVISSTPRVRGYTRDDNKEDGTSDVEVLVNPRARLKNTLDIDDSDNQINNNDIDSSDEDEGDIPTAYSVKLSDGSGTCQLFRMKWYLLFLVVCLSGFTSVCLGGYGYLLS